MSHHPFTTLTTPQGHKANIDNLMVPVVEAVWAAGFETSYCCQGAPTGNVAAGTGYICGPLYDHTSIRQLCMLLNPTLPKLRMGGITANRWSFNFDTLDDTPVEDWSSVLGQWYRSSELVAAWREIYAREER